MRHKEPFCSARGAPAAFTGNDQPFEKFFRPANANRCKLSFVTDAARQLFECIFVKLNTRLCRVRLNSVNSMRPYERFALRPTSFANATGRVGWSVLSVRAEGNAGQLEGNAVSEFVSLFK